MSAFPLSGLSHHRSRRLWLASLCALRIGVTCAQDTDTDAAALTLADTASEQTAAHSARPWHAWLETALDRLSVRGADSPQYAQRVSLDARYDSQLSHELRAILADRLDLERQSSPVDTSSINTLKEAYLSWSASPGAILDLGRINVRGGVGLAYNPTDYFRVGAVRSVVSVSPQSLRENRLGSAMIRAQSFWTGGSLTALYSPRLASHPSDGPFNVDLGASNAQNRWLVALSQTLPYDFSPQLLLFGSEGASPQLGLNLTRLLSTSTVAFLEWSGGRGTDLLAQWAAAPSARTKFASRLTAGITYTTPNRISLSFEYEQNEAAPGSEQWAAVRGNAGGLQAARYLQFVSARQDLPTRGSFLALAQWTDSLWQHLDLQAFTRINAQDHSLLGWAEVRYHWSHLEVAAQWQINTGAPGTVFGSSPERRLWRVLLAWYFP